MSTVNAAPAAEEAAIKRAYEAVAALAPKSMERYRRDQQRGLIENRVWEPFPIYFVSGQGPHITDVDGNEWVDCVLGMGPNILGHSHPAIVDAVQQQVARGFTFGSASDVQSDLASLIMAHVPGAEMLAFATTGTEALMAAFRLAFAFTGRRRIAKFDGGFHGWSDLACHSYPGSELGVSTPESQGLIDGVSELVSTLPFNDPAAFARIREEGDDLACVVLEGIQAFGGAIAVEPEFLRELRELCDELGILLVLDETITGFRLGPGGAAAHFGVTPDLVTLGKAIGGGLPVGAITGRADVLELLGRAGARDCVVSSGTFSGNPTTMSAGLAALTELTKDEGAAYARLWVLGDTLRAKLGQIVSDLEVQAHVIGLGPNWNIHFGPTPPRSQADRLKSNRTAARLLSTHLWLNGVFVSAPFRFGYLSTSHTVHELDHIAEATRSALLCMREDGIV